MGDSMQVAENQTASPATTTQAERAQGAVRRLWHPLDEQEPGGHAQHGESTETLDTLEELFECPFFAALLENQDLTNLDPNWAADGPPTTPVPGEALHTGQQPEQKGPPALIERNTMGNWR